MNRLWRGRRYQPRAKYHRSAEVGDDPESATATPAPSARTPWGTLDTCSGVAEEILVVISAARHGRSPAGNSDDIGRCAPRSSRRGPQFHGRRGPAANVLGGR